ncbi:MAG: ATP-dependent Clp protease ATP-binding subunit, partial [Deltaproteobacteria bacterium]|nr:ATP-dependent Clp protease ATP-binding subunit [Deltaproteobacteria bacterium]
MTATDGMEYMQAVREAEDIAGEVGQQLNSAHLLLALFTFPSKAKALLNEREITEETVLDQITSMQPEERQVIGYIKDVSRRVAKSAGSAEVDTLHLLIAITRTRDTFAYYILDKAQVPITALRNTAMQYLSHGMPRRLKTELARANRKPTSAGRGLAATARRRSPRREQEVVIEREAPAALDDAPVPRPGDVPAADAAHAAPAAKENKTNKPRLAPRLDPEVFPTLAEVGVDLIAQAEDGRLDEVVARDREMLQLIDVLGKRRANNPCLVGPPGVGKTAIAEGLAVKIARGDEDVAHMADRLIVSLDTGSLVAGTSLRGAFSERLSLIKEEVASARGKVVVFIDELHTLIGAGASGEGAQDAANELKSALARGEFPCIGATTEEEYKKYIEQDAALERRFTPVLIDEPSEDDAILILETAVATYAGHHHVSYSPQSVQAACRLSARFIPDRRLPDKAIALIDLAGSRARRRGVDVVQRDDIARLVHEQTEVPLERLAAADLDHLAKAEEVIHRSFVGHDTVVARISDAIRRGYAGFNGHRPIASFLFLGPTGVGKTELCKVLAELLYGRRDALVRIDMSEFAEGHSSSRLVGAPPGYVGYGEGGQLTERVRKRPFQIVLFDEIEKAHRDVLNLLLQLLDDGRLTDGPGRTVSFANTLVVMTSNLGFAGQAAARSGAIGFGRSGRSDDGGGFDEQQVMDAAQERLVPELW